MHLNWDCHNTSEIIKQTSSFSRTFTTHYKVFQPSMCKHSLGTWIVAVLSTQHGDYSLTPKSTNWSRNWQRHAPPCWTWPQFHSRSAWGSLQSTCCNAGVSSKYSRLTNVISFCTRLNNILRMWHVSVCICLQLHRSQTMNHWLEMAAAGS